MVENQFYPSISNLIKEHFTSVLTEEFEKNWSSELEVYYNSRDFEFFSGSFATYVRLDSKKLFRLSGTEKEYIYILIRILSNATESTNSPWKLALEDLRNFYKSIGFQNNSPRYFYLENLSESMFLYEIDTQISKVFSPKERRVFYRIINNKTKIENKSLLELLTETTYFLPQWKVYRKPPSKRVERHKGYRDHGALGSELSRTLRDQAKDWSLKKKEEDKIKKSADFLDFLLGLGGWI